MAERFVLDNSVAMAWCFDDESDSYAREVLYSLRNAEALVPAIWPLEFGNALLVAERNRRLNKHDVATLLVNILKLPITVLQETPDRVLKEIVTLCTRTPSQHLRRFLSGYCHSAWDTPCDTGHSPRKSGKTMPCTFI